MFVSILIIVSLVSWFSAFGLFPISGFLNSSVWAFSSSISALCEIIIALRIPGHSYWRLPAPIPIFWISNVSGSLSFVFTAATIAAPVGVTSSPSTSVIFRCKWLALTIFATAGTGIGRMPCWQRTVPRPSQRTGTITSVTSRSSRQTATDTISTIESTAPTSWKCTWSTGTLCALLSASARISNIRNAIFFAFSVIALCSII